MVDSSSSIVLLGSNRNIGGYMGRGRCRCRWLKRASAWIRASVSKMTFLSIGIALPFSMHWVLGSLGPLNTLISSGRSLEIIGALNHLALWGRKSLSSWLRSLLKL
jgi:hypothetical protein